MGWDGVGWHTIVAAGEVPIRRLLVPTSSQQGPSRSGTLWLRRALQGQRCRDARR